MLEHISHLQIIGSLVGVLVPLYGMHIRFMLRQTKLMVEHEMLVDLMCQLNGIKRSDLPTRHKNGD